MRPRELPGVYDALLDEYGPQLWWPARTPFEMTVGAILTQNTAWTNVEKAIANLRSAGKLSAERISRARESTIAGLVRPAGYFNQKARRLKLWARYFSNGWRRSRGRPTDELREELLGLRGIGPETADSILCYALGRPVFVVDAYTRRIFSRAGLIAGDEPYETVRGIFERAMPADAEVLGEFHALVVRHAKEHCGKKPACRGCVVRGCAGRAKED